MSMYAQELPTTATLQQEYPLNDEAEIEIALNRERIGGILDGQARGLVAIIGPCAMNNQADIIASEGLQLKQLTSAHVGLVAVHRTPVWKPRTNPNKWHGLETTDSEAAYATLAHQANNGAGVSIELANEHHQERYGNLLVMGWFGGRNIGKTEMMQTVAMQDTGLPLAVKNGLDGSIEPALQNVAKLREMRGDDSAPVVLLYRGGENAQDPAAWERQYRLALEATQGGLIVDVAHGSEMAHDPAGRFKKSALGQVAAMRHVIRIAESAGEIPAGIMAEASDADSPTDPHMAFQLAVSGILALNKIVMQPRDPWSMAIRSSVRSGTL